MEEQVSRFLGEGVPVFDGPRTGLRLLDAQVLDGSQLILARYEATAGPGAGRG